MRKAATSGNSKFFLGTDSAPHLSNQKFPDISTKPGIFSATSSIELYASIFEEENSFFFRMPLSLKVNTTTLLSLRTC